ncbi:MAG: hypothetical protein IPM39_10270 [Chloroflexi bacterium]|nr:hypothetical protein [Chloroflexota bacterium]
MLPNAPILLLDEPTASLDPQTEEAVPDTIFRLAEGRSRLLITHSPAGLAQVDEVVALADGRLVGDRGEKVHGSE